MSFMDYVKKEHKKISFKEFAKKEYERLEKDNFPPFKRASIVLTNNHTSFFAKLIRWKGKKDSGKCFVNHGERYVCCGLSISADAKVNIHPIKKFFTGNYDIYIFTNFKYSDNDRNKLIYESLKFHGKFYDVRGIFGQAVAFLTGKEKFAKKINNKNLPYCTEMISLVENTILDKLFCNKDPNTITPDNIYDYISKNKDWILSYSLVKKEE